jgi:uncharacterized repeat protein (TIGR03803 family)
MTCETSFRYARSKNWLGLYELSAISTLAIEELFQMRIFSFLASIGISLACAAAQTALPTLTTIYSITGGNDGVNPQSALVADASGVLYGTTFIGGPYSRGALFSLTPPAAAGGAWTPAVLHTFAGRGDGANPVAPMVMDKNGVLYGSTIGSNGVSFGTIFMVTPPTTPGGAWVERTIWNFTLPNGIQPEGALYLTKSGILIGTARYGGGGFGTIFALKPPPPPSTGWTFYLLHSFTGLDGTAPSARFIADKYGALYSTTYKGGAADFGTVYKLTPPATPGAGWTETVLHNFTGGTDGGNPASGLTQGANGVFYGATQYGGATGLGTLFSLTPPATPGGAWTQKVLHSFSGGTDGAQPFSDLLLTAKGALIGTTSAGGVAGAGNVFALSPGASGAWNFNILHGFTGPDGANPYAGLIASGGALYGTTSNGGTVGFGTVFQLK